MAAPPTLPGPLAHGATYVRVLGVVANLGDLVEIQVLSANPLTSPFAVLATHNSAAADDVVDVLIWLPLAQGQFVWARQTVLGVDSGWGTAVEVCAAPVALPQPVLPSFVDAHAEGILVFGAHPCCPVEIRSAGLSIASGLADHEGTARLQLLSPLFVGAVLTARVQVDGVWGPDGPEAIVAPAPAVRVWPELTVEALDGSPWVRIRGALPGARVVIETQGQMPFGLFSDAGSAVCFESQTWLRCIYALVPGLIFRVRQEFSGLASSDAGPWYEPPLLDVSPLGAPALSSPPLVGDTRVWVKNLWPGTIATIRLSYLALLPFGGAQFSYELTSVHAAVPDHAPLDLGGLVLLPSWDVDVLVNGAATGLPVTTEAIPVQFPPFAGPPVPTLLPHLLEGSRAVEVMQVAPGTEVEVRREADWALLGARRARYDEWAVDVRVHAPLQLTDLIAARATRHGLGWSSYGPSLPVGSGVRVRPIVIGPICTGDVWMLVVGVRPGSIVSVEGRDANTHWQCVRVQFAAEPSARMFVHAIQAEKVRIATFIGNEVRYSEEVSVLSSPSSPGPYATGQSLVIHNGVAQEVYFPADALSGTMLSDLIAPPLVILRHGDPPVLPTPASFLGYAYLASHLASWGMYVVSLDDGSGLPSTLTAGISVLPLIEEWRLTPPMVGSVQLPANYFGPTGLFGQSNGGAAVLNAEFESTVDHAIRAVSTFAPNVLALGPSVYHGRSGFQVITGTLDVVGRSNGDFSGYERLPRPKYGAFIPRGWHSPPNTVWEAVHEPARLPVGALDGDLERAIVIELVTAFFFVELFGRRVYEGRLDCTAPGTICLQNAVTLDRQAVSGPEGRADRLFASPLIIENNGAADAQLFLEPTFSGGQGNAYLDDPDTNTLGWANVWLGPALTPPAMEVQFRATSPNLPMFRAVTAIWTDPAECALVVGFGATLDLPGVEIDGQDGLRLRAVRVTDDPNQLFVQPLASIDARCALMLGGEELTATRLGAICAIPAQFVGDAFTNPAGAVNTSFYTDPLPSTVVVPLMSFAAAALGPIDWRSVDAFRFDTFSVPDVILRLVSLEVGR